MADNVNALLTKRLKKNENSSKMAELAKHSAKGNLTSFSGMFSVVELNEGEKEFLEAILHEYSAGTENISVDLRSLTSITSEVKAINNQAAILHGERIRRAQDILKKYREGAFTTWLVAAYGNRQTPYNFLQYYNFYSAMPKTLRPQIELMPRQAIYTLASREGALEKKRHIVENYRGETKSEVLNLIRELFPLPAEDKRKENIGEGTKRSLTRLLVLVKNRRTTISKAQKREIFALLDQMYDLVELCKTR
ncbi:MAG: pGP6-D family virulence protein [Waddliaceae bacterium]